MANPEHISQKVQGQLLDDAARTLAQSAALEAADHAMMLTDSAGLIGWVNPAFSVLTGLSAAEVVGQHSWLFQSDFHDATGYEAFWQSIREGRVWHGEFANHRQDGSRYAVEATVTPVRAEGGAITHYFSVLQDITGRKHAEEELRQQVELLDLTSDSLVVRDMEDRITFWNHGAEELYGWTAAEATGRVTHTLLHAQFPRPLVEIKAEFAVSGRWEGEVVHSTRDGRLLMVASRWSLQRDKSGTPHAILEIDTDITNRKCAEEALRQTRDQLELRVEARTADLQTANEALVESQDRFRQMAENIRDVFWLATPGMASFIYVSPAYEEIWGRSCEALYQHPRSWFEAIHPEDQSPLWQAFEKPIPEEGYERSYRVIRPDGAVRWVLDRGFPVRHSGGKVNRLVGIAQDITERRELEQEVLAISEREQRRIGQDLHDDLCQQLVGIEFLSKALQQQLRSQPQAAQAGEIARLIRAAIDYTRLLARGLAPIDLEAEGLMRGLRTLAARTTEVFRIPCTFQCPSPVLIHDMAVGTCLYRIAQEAVANSIKHAKAKQLEIRLAASPTNAVLEINDDGVGFSDSARNPRGMGLRIMQYRAAMNGGTVAVQRQPRGGTSVVCTLPRPSEKQDRLSEQ